MVLAEGWFDPVAVSTLALVLVTLGLVVVTGVQLVLSRRDVELSVRPLLAEAPEPAADGPPEAVTFGAPGRDTVLIRDGEFWFDRPEQGRSGNVQVSVAFRNVGNGLAVIVGAGTEPEVTGSRKTSRMYVPVGETVRVNVSTLVEDNGDDTERWWHYANLAVFVRYTDADGKQPLTTKALVREYAVHEPHVERVEIWRDGDDKPFIASGEWGG
jgi:hypothetical protein